MIALFLLAAGCGNDRAGDMPDAPITGTGPRFYEDVAPIFAAQCVSCHREGGVGPFELVTYEDARAVAPGIPAAVTTRAMPPWGADNSGECNTYQHARWLTDAEIKTVADWARGDQLEGNPAAAPPLPPSPPGLARVDATASMAEPYSADAQLDDDYRCFVVDPGIASDAFLTGFEVRPGEPEVVHHILMYQVNTAAAEAELATLDAQSPGPGYTCFGGPAAAASLIGVWAPGIRVASYPAGTGLPLKAARKIVLQIHYHNHAGPRPDLTSVDLMIEPTVPEPSFLYLLAAPDLYLPPGMPAVRTENEYVLPGFLGQYNVWGVFPHMHTLGRTLRVEADHAGQTKCLADVPRWDFNWQQGYFYDGAPHIIGGGDTIRIECVHDTTTTTQPITWGEGTDDEMCLAFMYVSAY
ncbi:MAG: hypothetical protein WKG01_05560 [Kofleriaceae bacterium]